MHDTKKIVAYTAIVDNYNPLQNPLYIDPQIDYVCFTDQPKWCSLVNNTVWKCRPFPRMDLDATRMNRYVKILPHLFFPEYEYSIYVDGSIRITGDVRELLNQYGHPNMLSFKHPRRSCIYEEGKVCIEMRKEDPDTITRQLEAYRSEGFPERFGLTENNVLIRQHNNPIIIKLMEDWWREVITKSRRDQLSFPYVAWRNGFWPVTMGEESVWGTSRVFELNTTTHHGSKKMKLLERLRILSDIYLMWRFKR
jgi:hypothetical protein